MTISNTGFSPSDVRLYLPLPVEWDAQKELNIVEITPEPDSQTTAEPSGNAMLYWQLKQTPKKNTTKEIILDFTLTAYETNTQIDPASVQLYRQGSEEVLRYTKSEVYIESDDPEIISLADTLAGKETNPYMIAKIFYDHIIDTAEYQLLGQGLNGAKYLLENGEGECGDYSALFVALCRAKGIPARPVVGYWAVSGNEQTHVWAEFFLESIGWIPVDATIGQQSDENRSYYFGNMDNQRVILSKGYNTPLVPEGPDGFIAPILQVPLWWFWGSGNADGFSLQRDWHVDKIQ
jgi:transglutaminase-like putative cysteine protease